MKHSLIILPEEEIDLAEVSDWYNMESPGLETRFLKAVGDIFECIKVSPIQFPVIRKNVRRAVLDDFPYSVFFAPDEEGKIVFVLAVLHQARDPKMWKSRL